ncbi:MAG: sigma-70 family RNA polymerase sigma factor [Bacteroidales bacterium]|nr:sigma-70 family RNA polymerase sigma factor [Bacteroidales bacterium]
MGIFRRKESFDPTDSNAVITACRRNDPQAQRALVKLYYGYVKSLALRFSSDQMDAEEILNDSFLKVFTNLNTYNESQEFKGWLRRIVINTAIDAYRKRSKIPESSEPDPGIINEFTEDAIDRISAEEILQMVRSLTPAYRMVFTLYAIEGYTHKEIAEMLGISEGTSKSNLRDARIRLQKMIFKANPNLYKAYELKNLPTDEHRKI